MRLRSDVFSGPTMKKDCGDESNDVDRFLLENIDTVPHLEALLLLRNSCPAAWSVEEMAERLFLGAESAKDILNNLVRQHLIVVVSRSPESYCYEPEPSRERIISAVDLAYRRELVRISMLIHSKPSAAVREFARAFRIKKERD